MQYEFRGTTVHEAVRNALNNKGARVESDTQVQTCKYVSQKIMELGRTADRAVSDIESVSDDLKRRIEELGNQDRWAALKLASAAAAAVTGLGALYAVAKQFPRLTTVGAVLSSLSQGKREVEDIVSAVDTVLSELSKIREGLDISGPRRKLNRAKTMLQSAQWDMREIARLYDQNDCSIVTETFGRGY